MRESTTINPQHRILSLQLMSLHTEAEWRVGNLIIVGSDNGLWSSRCQAIIWTNVGIFLSGLLWINFCENLFEILENAIEKVKFKMASILPQLWFLKLPMPMNCHDFHFFRFYLSVAGV